MRKVDMSGIDTTPPSTWSPEELRPEFFGLAGLSSFAKHNSASRLQMYCSHVGQALPVKGASRKRIRSGAEQEFGKYTFKIKMPCNAIILKVVQKYPRSFGIEEVQEPPLTLVIYENMDHPMREIGVLEIPRYHCSHQHYGFRYVFNPDVINRLVPGAMISKDTVIADSPTITKDGDYMYGLEAKTCMMSLHLNIEDGIVISKSFAKRLTTKGFGKSIVSWGKNRYPLNLEGYGTIDNPKAFPSIGDRIRPDGLLMALREYDDVLSVVDMTRESLRRPDYAFDKLVYAEPNAKIVDIVIHKGNQLRSCIPNGLSVQPDIYMDKTNSFYDSILSEYNSVRKKRGAVPRISPEFHRYIVEAMAMRNQDTTNRIQHTFNRNPADEWRVEIHYEYDLEPSIGAKLTGSAGDKGVVVAIWDDELMPVDKWGNRVEVITDRDSTVKRMNLGRMFEQFFNAAGDYVTRIVQNALEANTEGAIDAAWEELMFLYKTVAPKQHELVRLAYSGKKRLVHLKHVAMDGVYLYCPLNNNVRYWLAVLAINDRYPDMIGPVTYVDSLGETVTTVSPILVGSMYTLLLEKTGNTWASCSSARLQHHGIPAKATKEDKHTKPGRHQAIRLNGETEVRLFAAIMGGHVIADRLDQTNNPRVHKAIIENILSAPKPSAIPLVVDRKEYPMGNGRMQSLVRHMLECAGVRFIRTDEEFDSK